MRSCEDGSEFMRAEGYPCDQCKNDDKAGECVRCDEGNSGFEQKRGKALRKALKIINGERQDSYGNPEDSFAVIAEYWNTYLIEIQKAILVKNGFDLADYKLADLLDGRNVAEMMALFKIARMTGQKTTFDNYADGAGYLGIAGDMI